MATLEWNQGHVNTMCDFEEVTSSLLCTVVSSFVKQTVVLT